MSTNRKITATVDGVTSTLVNVYLSREEVLAILALDDFVSGSPNHSPRGFYHSAVQKLGQALGLEDDSTVPRVKGDIFYYSDPDLCPRRNRLANLQADCERAYAAYHTASQKLLAAKQEVEE